MAQVVPPTVSPDPANLPAGERASKLLRQGSKLLNLVAIAKSQKLLLYLILAQIGGYVMLITASSISPVLGVIVPFVYLLIAIATIVFVGRLAYQCGYNIVIVVITCIFMIVPIIGLLLILSVNSKATTLLKLAGANVGLMGVSEKEMMKLYEGACDRCGYNLRDLKADRCPECGTGFTRPVLA